MEMLLHIIFCDCALKDSSFFFLKTTSQDRGEAQHWRWPATWGRYFERSGQEGDDAIGFHQIVVFTFIYNRWHHRHRHHKVAIPQGGGLWQGDGRYRGIGRRCPQSGEQIKRYHRDYGEEGEKYKSQMSNVHVPMASFVPISRVFLCD